MDSEPTFLRALLEATLLKSELWRAGLRIHATRLPLGLLCALAAHVSDNKLTAAEYLPLLKREIASHAIPFVTGLASFDEEGPLDPLVIQDGFGFVKGGVRLLLIGEFISLYDAIQGEPANQETKQLEQALRALMMLPATTRPLSDNYAVSVLSIAVAARRRGVPIVRWLEKQAVWVCDCHADEGIGLARPGESTVDELWRTLGGRIDNPAYHPRRTSWLAAALLDACSLLREPAAYDDIRNDLLAVRVIPQRFVPSGAVPNEFIMGGRGLITATAGDYAEAWRGVDGWMNSGLHERADAPRWFDTQGDHWVGLGLSLALRDRWWIHSLRMLLPVPAQ